MHSEAQGRSSARAATAVCMTLRSSPTTPPSTPGRTRKPAVSTKSSPPRPRPCGTMTPAPRCSTSTALQRSVARHRPENSKLVYSDAVTRVLDAEETAPARRPKARVDPPPAVVKRGDYDRPRPRTCGRSRLRALGEPRWLRSSAAHSCRRQFKLVRTRHGSL